MIPNAEELVYIPPIFPEATTLHNLMWVQVLEIKVLLKAELLGTIVLLYSSVLKFDALMELHYVLAW